MNNSGCWARALRWAAVVGVLLFAGGALADPIGPDCGTCQGSIYTLTASDAPIATTATTQTFRITLAIDSSGYTGVGTGIDTVAIKVASAVVAGSLVDAPFGAANWLSYVNQGLNSGGCASGGSGFDCAIVDLQMSFSTLVPNVGGTLVWVWDLEIETDTLLTGPFEASMKARYVNVSRLKVGALVSEDITLGSPGGGPYPIPEPGSLGLVGLGMLGIAARSRRPR